MDIIHEFEINANIEDVFKIISTPKGIQKWWSMESFGTPELNEEYILKFGVGYEWRANVTTYLEYSEFELTIINAVSDWNNTKIHFLLFEVDSKTRVRFSHKNWPEINEHYRVSCYCWAMYLRLLKRNVEHGEFVDYEDRLNV